jgi:hypothetical protein
MKSIEQSRALLGGLGRTLSDEEVKEIQAQSRRVAEIVFEWWLERRNQRLPRADSPSASPQG